MASPRTGLDFSAPAAPDSASAENPPIAGGFGGGKKPNWIEEEIPVKPASGDYTEKIWEYIYNAINGIAPYPITIDQAVEVVRITDMIKAQSRVQDVRR